MAQHAPFHILINRRPEEALSTPMTGAEILALGQYDASYELYLLHGEGDQTGGALVAPDQQVEIHSGLHFRAIPGNANFGLVGSSGNQDLDADVKRLTDQGYDLELLTEGPQVGVVVHDVPLPAGYSQATTNLLLQTTLQYPADAMDMFWVDEPLILANGAIPQSGDSVEVHFGRTWRRFSWHRNAPWIPGRDDLVGHLEFSLARLQRPQ